MDEYIKKNDLLELYTLEGFEEYAATLSVPIPVIRQNIMDLPAEDVTPVVHGRWVPRYEIKEMYYSPDDVEQYKVPDGFSCSVCDKWSSAKTNYCSNCGAKMDGE